MAHMAYSKRILRNRFYHFEEQHRVTVSDDAKKLIEILLDSYTVEPAREWRARSKQLKLSEAEFLRACSVKQNYMFDQLHVYLNQMVTDYGCSEKICTPDVIHWLTNHKHTVDPMPTKIPRPNPTQDEGTDDE